MIEQLRQSTPTARKAHHCSLCHGTISAGETYTRSSNVFDGHVYDFLTCQGCEADRILGRVYDWCGDPDEGVSFDDAIEWATDHAEHGGGAAKGAASRYLDRYRKVRADR
ncbi:hypothetical protein NCCP2495_05610 [Dietzia sp. NCCP-2495]|uniref:hypothetical protein n=1 Tax=Dietzia sp. NCCP-2495 TaxID=2934675 RepID=UPI0022315779|nr:hypothetical protein [Dietzia sp. NCCP-2495]GLB62683.1 hypothetical protein NCCP2495_05610 [Dietzia sp. NCCP-2495]